MCENKEGKHKFSMALWKPQSISLYLECVAVAAELAQLVQTGVQPAEQLFGAVRHRVVSEEEVRGCYPT